MRYGDINDLTAAIYQKLAREFWVSGNFMFNYRDMTLNPIVQKEIDAHCVIRRQQSAEYSKLSRQIMGITEDDYLY